jgi:hypothetical protein
MPNREVEKNGMLMRWYYQHDSIHLEVRAPTRGWVTVGFNEKESMSGAYLLMGRVRNGRAEVVEHYTHSSGNYQPITTLGESSLISTVEGEELDHTTVIRYAIPIHPPTRYRKDLAPGNSYFMTLAFSREDDFQHHSMMRTSVNVTL